MAGMSVLAVAPLTAPSFRKLSPVCFSKCSTQSSYRARSYLKAKKTKDEEAVELETAENVDKSVSQTSDVLVEMGAPILNNLGFSGAAGLSVAITIKVVGSIAAVLLGLTFVALQVLAYFGLIDIKWKVMEDALSRALDANGDGKVDRDDAKIILDQGLGFLSQGVPSVAGFCAGFLLGLKVF